VRDGATAVTSRLLDRGGKDQVLHALADGLAPEPHEALDGGAIAHYKRAWERSPDRDDLLQNVARLAAAERMHGEALDAYSKLAARARSDQERDRWAQAAAAEKAALQASVYENRK
jgi:hypothetical protein